MRCRFCNSTYHEPKGKGINQLDLLQCIAKNLADLVVTMEAQ
jgi:hypothetical protein